jgi:hypothetical protein
MDDQTRGRKLIENMWPNLQHHFLLQLCRKASAAQGIHQPRGSRGDGEVAGNLGYMATV